MKIYLDSIGCRLNQAEIERYARQFRAAGHILVASPEQADLAVVNTCTVTGEAASDSRGKIRQLARAGVEQIIATGCWASLNPEQAAGLPGVRHVIPNQAKDHLVNDLLNLPDEAFDLEPVERQPVPGARLRTRAFIKAQDGCDNFCTFCITTLARGAGRSRSMAEILADIRLVGEAQEVVLTGVHLGSWGQDLSPVRHLSHLVQAILDETDVPRLRLSSLEPWDLDEDFFSLWQNPRLCRHLHLPLQSGSASVLRRMARKTDPEHYAALVDSARSAIPDVAVTTDIIAGFPGESETEFAESLAFVQAMDFADGHVFTYSARPGTAAARLPGQVPYELRKKRNARMREHFEQARRQYQARFVGQVLPVLWESATALGPEGWEMSGLTGNYLRVNARASHHLWNRITPVSLLGLAENGLYGQIQP
ncbi:MAG: MiaB/RimO family radical SAM methylthiotransferase [Anaerolineales bacterium]|nr:MiaB/RimO family radical SAM methylthiotransferase [Anaerolineales bacterium]